MAAEVRVFVSVFFNRAGLAALKAICGVVNVTEIAPSQ